MLGNVVGAETCVWFRCNRASEHATFAFVRECAATIDSFFGDATVSSILKPRMMQSIASWRIVAMNERNDT